MHAENNHMVFNTGKKVPCEDEMFSISENGVFRTMAPDNVIQEYKLNSKEVREVVNFLLQRVDYLIQTIL